MEEKIKSVLSLYIKVPVDQINSQTIIDRSAVESSILLHRMYANLLKEDIVIDNYWDVKTYQDLLMSVNGYAVPQSISDNKISLAANNESVNNSSSLVGIDIEEISKLPKVNDFREDAFYTMNFSGSEIAYCILKPDPMASFTGLFAAKEAIVKADHQLASKPFNSIIIEHLPNGTPVYPSFQLSISHTNSVAIAVAIKNLPIVLPSVPAVILPAVITSPKKNNLILFLAFTAVIISITAILISIFKK